MDGDRIRQLLPHYAAMILILLVALAIIEAFFPDRSFWIGIGVAVLVGLAYPHVVRRLGVAPESWQRS